MPLMIGVLSVSGMPSVGLYKALSPVALRPAGDFTYISIPQGDTENVDMLDAQVESTLGLAPAHITFDTLITI